MKIIIKVIDKDKTKINSTMEAPSTTSTAIVPLVAREDILLAILEACSKVMPEGHMLVVADFLKNINATNVGVPEVPAEIQLHRVLLVYFEYTVRDNGDDDDEDDDDDNSRVECINYILTEGDDYDRRSYVKVVQTQSRSSVQVRLSNLDTYLKVCLKEKLFDRVKIITNDSIMPKTIIDFKEYRRMLPEHNNFYDEFCKYTANTILLAYNFFILVDRDRDVIRR